MDNNLTKVLLRFGQHIHALQQILHNYMFIQGKVPVKDRAALRFV